MKTKCNSIQPSPSVRIRLDDAGEFSLIQGGLQLTIETKAGGRLRLNIQVPRDLALESKNVVSRGCLKRQETTPDQLDLFQTGANTIAKDQLA